MQFLSVLSYQCLIIVGNECTALELSVFSPFYNSCLVHHSINNTITSKTDVISHQARSAVVPSLAVAGLAMGSDCLRVGRTTGRTAAQKPVG